MLDAVAPVDVRDITRVAFALPDHPVPLRTLRLATLYEPGVLVHVDSVVRRADRQVSAGQACGLVDTVAELDIVQVRVAVLRLPCGVEQFELTT